MSDVRELTPPGAGGVAVLSVRGVRALERLAQLAGGRLPEAGDVRFVRLVADRAGPGEELLDEGLLVRRGDGSVEVHVHGGRAVVGAVTFWLTQSATAAAGPSGEGVGSDALAEHLRSLAARAPTVLGARLVLAQADGERLRRALSRLLAVDGDERRALARGLLAQAQLYGALIRPGRIVLRGPVNAGKSTLINTLAGTEVALVSDVPGTTRDTVAAEVELGGWPFVVVDTAGDRDVDADANAAAPASARAIERAGQGLAGEASARADLVLVVALADAAEAVRPVTQDRPGPRQARVFTRAAPVFGEDVARWPPDHVSALEHAGHAVVRVGEIVLRALGRPALDALGERLARGDAPVVPFGEALVAALERVAVAPDAHNAVSQSVPPLDALERLL